MCQAKELGTIHAWKGFSSPGQGGVPIPRGISNPCGFGGTWIRGGLWVPGVVGMDLQGLFQPKWFRDFISSHLQSCIQHLDQGQDVELLEQSQRGSWRCFDTRCFPKVCYLFNRYCIYYWNWEGASVVSAYVTHTGNKKMISDEPRDSETRY